jgi:hypothetical protein
MASNVRRIEVTEPEQMQLEITRLVSEGFTVANQNDRSVTLVKRKQFSIPILIIGFFLCIIPLVIYLIMYAMQKDQIVEIKLMDKPESRAYRASDHIAVDGEVARVPEDAPIIQVSPDGQQWWDGSQWQDTASSYPQHAYRNPDGSEWWDGQSWHPVPRDA